MSMIHLAKKYIVPHLDKGLLNEQLHGECAELIRKNRESLILLPRGFGKTTFFTEIEAIREILGNQNIRVCIVSHSYKKAVEILNHIKSYLILPKLKKMFPHILWGDNRPNEATWKEDAIQLRQTQAGLGNTLEVFGIDQDITGSHYDVIFFDDVVQKSNSNTPDKMKKVKKTFAAYSPILKPGGKKRITGTRYKLDDLYGDLIKLDVAYIVKEVEDEQGNLLDANILSREELEQKKKEIIAHDGLSYFTSQYFNKCIAEEDIKFQPEWVKFYSEKQTPKIIEIVYVLCDPAIGKNKRSDECVVQVILQTPDKMLYILSSEGNKEDVKESAYRIYEAFKFWKNKAIIKVGIETGGYQAALLQRTQEVMRETGVYFDIIELKPKGRPKDGRILNLVPYFKNDRIRLNNSCKALFDQLIHHGATLHDDHIDILAYVTDLIEESDDFDIFNIYDEEEDIYEYA